MLQKVKETTAFLKKIGIINPQIGVILGTGLGALVDQMEIKISIDYDQIPNFPPATVEFHKGQLLFGRIGEKNVIVMKGRLHYYEGYSLAEVVFPVRVMKNLGINTLLVSNAGGNMNKSWKKGQLMMINDHINLLPDNPLRGKGASDFGPIFTDMSKPYDNVLNSLLKKIALSNKIKLNEGVYVAVSGPNLETRAEYRYLKKIGADVVGMSTVPEVIAANQMKLPVCAVSVLTDDCDPDNLQPINIDEIIKTAGIAEIDLVKLFVELIHVI